VHRRDRGHPGLDRRPSDLRTRVAVPTRPERRARDDEVRGLGLGELEDPGGRLLLVLREVIVPAGDGRHDLDPLEGRGEAAPRTNRAIESDRRRLGLVLSADPREELVQVVNGPHHEVTPRSSWPI
jgi:hypothetical protein